MFSSVKSPSDGCSFMDSSMEESIRNRASLPVGLPVPNSTQSYWQTPLADIANLRSTEELPADADYVVIGSGISGACIAFDILERKSNARVVMLEARQACSGATGRNGGHTKPASYRAFMQNEAAWGLDEAIRISQLEYSNRTRTIEFAGKHNLACDLNPCLTTDIIYSAAQLEAGTRAIRYMQSVVPPGTTESYTIYSAAEAATKFFTPDALGAFESDAGSIHPYKFTVGTLKLGLAAGLNLQTNTPATAIAQDPETHRWTVTTPRGTISTPTLVLATNAYTPFLLPETHTRIVPLRGQMSVQRPGTGLPDAGSLATTYSFVYENGYEYMIPRPAHATPFPGDICIGGGIATLPAEGASEFGTTDDASLNPALTTYLADSTVRYFGAANWGHDHVEGRVRQEWTGIMGITPDGLPMVGEMPGKPGLWVSVGFNGHGMSLALNAARGLVQMVMGEWEEWVKWFPKSYVISEERLRKEFQGLRHARVPKRGGCETQGA